ncbi:MAG: hypothetical protein Q7U02_05040, partial [Desulfosalsimonadaceae bacterium]|nr:hypothetical protein [Desulfosalsimonadaceae bacterium]
MNNNNNDHIQAKIERRQARRASLFEKNLMRIAGKQALIMLKPMVMARNPVMFVTEVGSVLTTALWIQALVGHGEAQAAFIGAVALWLWLCVLFANFS